MGGAQSTYLRAISKNWYRIAASTNLKAVLFGRCCSFSTIFKAYYALFALVLSISLDASKDPAALVSTKLRQY